MIPAGLSASMTGEGGADDSEDDSEAERDILGGEKLYRWFGLLGGCAWPGEIGRSPVNQRRGYSLRVWVKLLASYMVHCGDLPTIEEWKENRRD